MKRYYLIVTASKPTETDAVPRIKQFIALGRRLGLRIELGPDSERPPPSVRSAKARRELVQQMARVQP